MNGTIVRLIMDKGFGFIRGENGREYFFHRSSVRNGSGPFELMREQMNVSFEEEQSPKGPRATNVAEV